jgi:hypothetical protein
MERKLATMKFPYGISDFQKIIQEQYFYVDRTDRIRLLEDTGSQLLFLRPRRFGKSLLLSLLENYYDVAKAEEFEKLFGHLAIGKNPTSLHNRYFVLKWDFSVVSAEGNPEQIRQALHRYVNERIQNFAINYRALLPIEVRIEPVDAIASFQSLLTAIQQTPYRLYLLVDEYDNFANELMMGHRQESKSRYEALLSGEGVLKTLFKAVKSGATGQGIDRVFITGVSPVVLSDLISGCNVAENISLQARFNDLCGFWESDIATALNQITQDCQLPVEKATEALDMMRTFYNGYRFSYDTDQLIYNPTLALYFMKQFQQNGQYPRQILDYNLAMDRGKITYISQLPGGDQLILDVVSEEQPLSIQQLADRFGVEDMLQATKDNTSMASLLYYFGVLTLDGRTSLGKLVLKIPNLVTRKLYVERIEEMLVPDFKNRNEVQRVNEIFYSTGNIEPLCDFIEQKYFKVFDNRDYRWANELTVKTAFLTLLFNDVFYIMDSETSLERGYADLTMIVRPDMKKYELLDMLIEFKYVGLPEVGLSGEEVRSKGREELKESGPVKEKLEEAQVRLEG